MLKRTYQIQLKKGHRLYPYLNGLCGHAKNLSNATNFHIRQVYTALTSDGPLHPLQAGVINAIREQLPLMNESRLLAFEKRKRAQEPKPPDKRKDVRLHLFSEPTRERPYISYNFLDGFFKVTGNADYRSLPAHCAQGTMRQVFSDWTSFFRALRDWKQSPDKYKRRPNIPGYEKTDAKTVTFSNQECVVKGGRFLKFPQTADQLNIGKLGAKGVLKQVRVVPHKTWLTVEVVLDIETPDKPETDPSRVMGIDIGLANLAAVVTNTGRRPVLFKGTMAKNLNGYFNRKKQYLQRELPAGLYTSARLERLSRKRANKLLDLFHKASFHLVQIAVEERIGTIVIGKNKNWKQNIDIGRANNRDFTSVPHARFIELITYKAEALGMEVILTEESYTSKASFPDGDLLPVHGEQQAEKPRFSGRRITRGLYRTKDGQLINADVNAACNILRKGVPDVSLEGIKGFVSTPLSVCVR